MSWLPMGEAPRDGTRILGWFDDRCIAVFWREGPEYIRRPNGTGWKQSGARTWYWSDGYSRYREPDFWQPQPAPPVPDGKSWCDFCEDRISNLEAAGCRSPRCSLRAVA